LLSVFNSKGRGITMPTPTEKTVNKLRAYLDDEARVADTLLAVLWFSVAMDRAGVTFAELDRVEIGAACDEARSTVAASIREGE
jgi:hypothetical protein